ncbi:(2Fe-2S) ferredoxin domain-containing protein [Caenispirillum bisanense]|uniref:(2Fe-2S) ferredoxin n=1 Tax=Caenispirillum bisanense TaxID=414052 RepID=A0A286GTQ7_9PROT|nr:(2Fe-2S) ferredoxin domain-containing protein [Caenispirillum bisanense]SOD98933.1 (2Fe-2S) ferredoxin [Caenispirillum bisanense]
MSADPAPYYRAHVFACTNVRPEGHPRGSCARFGAEKLRNYMKARAKELKIDGVRVNNSGCLDRCELGPVIVVYPEGVWYAVRNADDIDEILQTHLIDGGRVARLMLSPEETERAQVAERVGEAAE